ncbi:MAG: DUF1648 domain-containing protein [Chloroflexota bacterium]
MGLLLQRLDRPFAAFFGAAAVLDLAIWLYVALRQSVLPDALPIHYNASGQVDRIGLRGQLFILPAIGLLTLLVNGGLAYAISRRERPLGYLLLALGVLVQLLLAGAAIQLVH